MGKRLIILLLIVGCDEPTEHSHDEHYTCIKHYNYQYYHHPIYPDSIFHSSDSGSVVHALNLNNAISYCLSYVHTISIMGGEVDSTWCDCELGILN